MKHTKFIGIALFLLASITVMVSSCKKEEIAPILINRENHGEYVFENASWKLISKNVEKYHAIGDLYINENNPKEYMFKIKEDTKTIVYEGSYRTKFVGNKRL